jgi:hypothetical protein
MSIKIKNESIIRAYVSEVLIEELGRDYKGSLGAHGISYDSMPGIDTEIFHNTLKDIYQAKVTIKDYPELSTNLRSFHSREDAQMFLRTHVDKAHRIIMNKI